VASETLTVNTEPKPMTAKKHGDLAAINTRFASERTLMAAVRTSLSLIGFGFTIYKFFESIVHTTGGAGALRIQAPRRLGFTLVSLGIFVLVAWTYQHWYFLKQLRTETDQVFPRSVSLITALLLALTGVVLLVVILARL
jgi:putative membrane protein